MRSTHWLHVVQTILASSEYWLWKVFLKIFIQIKFTMIDKHYLIKNYQHFIIPSREAI